MKISHVIKTFAFIAAIVCRWSSVLPAHAGPTSSHILIVYSSYTGNTKAACEAIQNHLGINALALKDLNNPPENLKMGKDVPPKLVLNTEIDPKSTDFSTSSCIVLGSPIWAATLAPAMRKFIELNRFDGKKVVLLTTTNASLNEEQKKNIKSLVSAKGGNVVGYYEILAQDTIHEKKVEKTKEQIKAEALKFAPEISNACAGGTASNM